ncbi:dockerin type I domain-containing protein [Adhaeretor mobilis]|uniref:PEP-CTERM protein-sorting domain-containing protein n=1 Tax=Adhaeretor mobilis TaxID=1930276 RepID=A0A517MVB7_9BACT|nr:dockerin type I domain-containing protein [Adhaeretor mobilis]QDS98816.1 hypothetical protein HG15A2_21010 [Adhaeretor mobilis]
MTFSRYYLMAPVAIALLATTAPRSAVAELKAHFDPNVLATQFSDGDYDGGTVPVTGIGDTARFVSDVRDPNPGAAGYGAGFIDLQNNNGPPIIAHPTQGSVWEFSGGNAYLSPRGSRDNTDGFEDNFDSNTLSAIVVGRFDASGSGTQYLFDLRDDSPIGGGSNTPDGFALRYDYNSGMLEGVAKQSVNAAVPLAVDSWFVATYAWDGANSTATLSVDSFYGSNSSSSAAETAALNPDAWRIGVNGSNTGATRLHGNMGDALFYNDVADHSAVANQLATDYQAKVPFELNVDQVSGMVTLKNSASAGYDIDAYRITSSGGSLNSSGWNTLDAQGFDGNAWSQLDADSSIISEGSFGTDSTVTGGGQLQLGAAFDTSVGVEDLVLEVHLAGDDATKFVLGNVNYVTGTASDADFNTDGNVDGLDFLTWQRGFGNFAGTAGQSDGDADGDGFVNGSDLTAWNSQYGSSPSQSAAASAVPEPTTALMALLAAVGLVSVVRPRRLASRNTTLACCLTLTLFVGLTSEVNATVFVDRDYTFGDEAGEGGATGNVLGSGNGFDSTWDSAGSPGAGDYQDLFVVNNPTYIAVGVGALNARPGAASGSLGVSFDGVDDYVSSPINLARPSEVWNNTLYYPSEDFPHNYDGIKLQGMQLWVKPNGATQAVRQDIIKNSGEHGISITENNTWGLVTDSPDPRDTGAAVAYDQWTHVEQVSGVPFITKGSSQYGGVLFVNGVAVGAHTAATEFYVNQPLTIGAMQLEGNLDGATASAPENYYHGLADDASVFLWGRSTGGDNYGTFNAGTDNEWIAMQLSGFDAADINLDGSVSGDGTGSSSSDDVSALIENWLTVRTVDDVQIGDWVSRQAGDLNFDGAVDLNDAFLLRDGLAASGLGALNFGLLQAVPEPAAATLAAIAMLLGLSVRRKQQ